MQKSFLKKLCCPLDKQDLQVQIFKEDEDKGIIEGLLKCPKCNRHYPIVYGVPIMIPDEYREKALEEPILKKWGLELDSKNQKLL